jgi:hypothetical protein
MPLILFTVVAVAAAVLAWKTWLSSWLILDVEPAQRTITPLPAPEPSHLAPSTVINVDLRGLTELVAAMNNHHHLPIVVFGFAVTMVSVVGLFVWGMVRITDNRRHYQPRYDAHPEIEHRPREERRELTVVNENNPFAKWRK